jgi:hypothetical protein
MALLFSVQGSLPIQKSQDTVEGCGHVDKQKPSLELFTYPFFVIKAGIVC